jgi:hypothetical protein
MKRVEKALVDLNTTNLRSNQNAISDFNALLNTGSAKLQEMLRVELNQHSTPIEPLHYLTKGTHVAQPTETKTNTNFFQIYLSHPYLKKQSLI